MKTVLLMALIVMLGAISRTVSAWAGDLPYIKHETNVLTDQEAGAINAKAWRINTKYDIDISIRLLKVVPNGDPLNSHANNVFHEEEPNRRVRIFLLASTVTDPSQIYIITDSSLLSKMSDDEREQVVAAWRHSPGLFEGLNAILDTVDKQFSQMDLCSDPDNARMALKLYMSAHIGVNETVIGLMIQAETHALDTQIAGGSKICQVDWKMDIEKARQIERGITGAHPLTRYAQHVNQRYEAGNPMHTRYKIAPNGEGGFNIWHLETDSTK